MAVTISARLEGVQELERRLREINPRTNTRIIARALRRAAGDIASNAKDKQIVGGGRSGKLASSASKPLPHKLTSRHGGSGLAGSIGVDASFLPFAVEVGTDRKYGAVHELGGRFAVGSYKRRTKSGREETVRAHTRTYPQRPFMQPALAAVRPRFPQIVREEWAREAKL